MLQNVRERKRAPCSKGCDGMVPWDENVVSCGCDGRYIFHCGMAKECMHQCVVCLHNKKQQFHSIGGNLVSWEFVAWALVDLPVQEKVFINT